MAFEILLLKSFVIVEGELGTPDVFVGRSVFAFSGVFGRVACFVAEKLFVPWLSDVRVTSFDQCPELQNMASSVLKFKQIIYACNRY